MEAHENGESEQAVSFSGLKQYFWLLVRWSWVIALAGVLTGVAAIVASKLQTPIYEASTTVLVDRPRSAWTLGPLTSTTRSS
jgi:uncharacterized protein involved in exopolysaccharide biosynthesis